jgi:hypothetical protein
MLRKLFAFAALLLAFAPLLLVSCSKPTAEPPEPIAVKLLVQHLIDAKRVVSSGRVADEIVWTDAAILERTKRLPPSLAAHLKAAPAGATTDEQMTSLLQKLELEQASWRPATVKRGSSGSDCAVAAGDVEAKVDCVYVNYLEVRYPQARFAAKGPLEAVLVLEGGVVRAALMPMKI